MKTITLYHGSISANNFKKFRCSKHGYLGQGVYFSDSEEVAKKYALRYSYGQIIKIIFYVYDNEILKICSSNPVKAILDFIYPNKKIYEKRKDLQENDTYIIEQKDINKLKKMGIKMIEWSLPLRVEKEYLILDKNSIIIDERKIISF